MKELYLDAEMEVVKFSVEDVIATSNTDVTETTAKVQGGGMGGPNEGEFGDEWL